MSAWIIWLNGEEWKVEWDQSFPFYSKLHLFICLYCLCHTHFALYLWNICGYVANSSIMSFLKADDPDECLFGDFKPHCGFMCGCVLVIWRHDENRIVGPYKHYNLKILTALTQGQNVWMPAAFCGWWCTVCIVMQTLLFLIYLQ